MSGETIRKDTAHRDLAGKWVFNSPDGDFLIDMINKIISLGANNEVYLDADNKRITVGANQEIVIDGDNKRITVGSNNEILIDGTNKRIVLKDGSLDNRILLDGANGEFKISKAGYNVLTTADANLLIRVGAKIFIRLGNLGFPVDQGERQWTESSSWTNIKNSTFKVDGDSFQFTKVYFEVLGCVESSGRTGYYRIYNVTDGNALSGSEISTTAVSNEGEDWINAELIRSGALTFPSGEKTYRLQFRQNATGGAGDTTQFFKGGLYYAQ